jgi:hypothetical protein
MQGIEKWKLKEMKEEGLSEEDKKAGDRWGERGDEDEDE